MSIISLMLHMLPSVPPRNGYKVTGELSRRNEISNGFPDGSRWLGLL
jgi:hypothetical protein